jgi:hypothetical protein
MKYAINMASRLSSQEVLGEELDDEKGSDLDVSQVCRTFAGKVSVWRHHFFIMIMFIRNKII